MGAGAPDIGVDVEALHSLARTVDSAAAGLVSDAGLFNDGANGIEHPELRATVNSFEERWSDRRREIHDALEATGSAMRKTATAFKDADEQLAACLDPGAGR